LWLHFQEEIAAWTAIAIDRISKLTRVKVQEAIDNHNTGSAAGSTKEATGAPVNWELIGG